MMTGVSPAPALAAGAHFKTLYETPRHIKAQACQYYAKSSSGPTIWKVRWRADARRASVGGSVQFHDTGGRGACTSSWEPVSRGKVSRKVTTAFLPDETHAVIYMRLGTKYGTSKWGVGRYIDALPTC
jgi:hypothetical protein